MLDPTPPPGPPPVHVGDHLALDFLNSIAAPRGEAIETIGTGRDWLAWLLAMGVVDPATADRVVRATPMSELDAAAGEAVDNREWFRGVVARVKAHGAEAFTPPDMARLNELLAASPTHRRVERAPQDGVLQGISARDIRRPEDLFGPIAEAMADLICSADFELVRKCENPVCTLWFYDRTKSHRRRWCSQAVCGNRSKAAAHRERLRRRAG